MLSILIPTYNYNVYPLVQELENQTLKANINFEIICIDDGSFSILNNENQKINTLTNCKFIENKRNIGLSNNRNKLVQNSQYDNLLFIDGDSEIINKDFINRYLETHTLETDIIYGGRIHPEIIEFRNNKLRWKYGRLVEDKTATLRKKNNYKTLMFNNTLIKRTCFDSIQFDKSITKYGHEDTLFAFQVRLAKYNVQHIKNPIIHGDIDDNTTFINKTEKGLENLLYLYRAKKINAGFVKILKIYKLITILGMRRLFSFLFAKFSPSIKRNLNSINPSLFLFKLYNIGYLCSPK